MISKFKKLIKFFLSKINYFLGIQRIPYIYDHINIETTSRCNLKCKFCAYDKRDLEVYPIETMNMDLFQNIVHQSIELGYKKIGLTPTTGDIYMDKSISQKIEYLENLNHYDGYFFYTNFIPIKKNQIEELFDKKKLISFGISIYGHDLETFKRFSGGSTNAYTRMIENLNHLEKTLQNKSINFEISISQRTEKNFNLIDNNSELSKIIQKILKISKITYEANSEFNNWGNIVKSEDVKNLNINLNTKKIPKTGSCSLIYSRLIVGANGLVNACACRDANFSLRLGNIKNDNIKNIVSLKNKKYKDLIERQERNDFPEVCKSCDFYRSIYQKNFPTWILKNKRNKYYKLSEVKDILEKR